MINCKLLAFLTVRNVQKKNMKGLCFPSSLFSHFRSVASYVGVGRDGRVQAFVNNRFIDSDSSINDVAETVTNPATQDILAKTPNCTVDEVDHAVNAASAAFSQWKNMPILKRMRYLINLHEAVLRNMEEIAHILTAEQGKTLSDAYREIGRGLDVVESMISAPNILTGKSCANVATGIDAASRRVPLGVCCGITPFNFPAMVPLWIFPAAIASGNTFVLKPSARVPLTTMKLAELCKEINLPAGVFNIIHGQESAVKHLCAHRDIQAISFVGGNSAGKAVYELAAKHKKRAQCNMGAKNHAVVLPDANLEKALTAVCNGAFGAAGQRCMAISVVILVGKAIEWEPKLAEIARKYSVGPGIDPKSDIGPMISIAAKEKALALCRESVQKFGAKFLVDGTGIKVPGFPKGNFFGPTVLTDVSTHTPAYKVELFAPALCVIKVATLDEAIEVVNRNPYGNGCALFTENGIAARKFSNSVEGNQFELGLANLLACLQIGINLSIPVPPANFSFTGWKDSMAGDIHMGGPEGLAFFTKTKNVLTRWGDSYHQSAHISGDFPSSH